MDPLPSLEIFLWLTVLGVIPLLLRRGKRERTDQLSSSFTLGEFCALAIILLVGTFLRCYHSMKELPGLTYTGAMTILQADTFAHDYTPTLWHFWVTLWPQYGLGNGTPLITPLTAWLGLLTGFSPLLIVVWGGLCGLVTMTAGWILFRRLYNPVGALCFVALLATSPLQWIWARIGFRVVASVPHVFLVSVLTYYGVCKRQSLLLILAALCLAAVVFNHDSARIAWFVMPFVAYCAAQSETKWQRIRNALFVWGGASAIAFCALACLYQTWPPSTLFWPGPLAFRDCPDRSPLELIHYIIKNFAAGTRQYFLSNRTDLRLIGGLFSPGPEYGGVQLWPIALLGFIGLPRMFCYRRQSLIWAAFAVGGSALFTLACAEARRLLYFDIAWLACAALGLEFLVRRVLVLGSVVGEYLFIVLLSCTSGVWGLLVLSTLLGLPSANIPSRSQSLVTVPFTATSQCSFSDIVVCPHCNNEVGRWDDKSDNSIATILVDSDTRRENPEAPGGFPALGSVHALSQGDRFLFVDFFSLLRNQLWDERAPVVYHQGTFDPANLTYDTIAALTTRTKKIRWRFESPLAWSRWLYRQLLPIADRHRSDIPFPLAEKNHTLEIPQQNYPAMLEVLDRLRDNAPLSSSCNPFSTIVNTNLATQPIYFSPVLPDLTKIESWIIGGPNSFQLNGKTTNLPLYEVGTAGEDPEHLRFISREGITSIVNQTTGSSRLSRVLHGPAHLLAPSCAVFASDQWWMIDPVTGELYRGDQTAPISNKQWIGITNGPGNRISLLSSQQKLTIFNPDEIREERTFPAQVIYRPTRIKNKCLAIAVGDSWFAVFHPNESTIAFYSLQGEYITEATLPNFTPSPHNSFSLAAHGDYLAVGDSSFQAFTIYKIDLNRCLQSSGSTSELLRQDASH